MKKRLLALLTGFGALAVILTGWVAPQPVLAVAECGVDDPLGLDCAASTGLTNQDPRLVVGRIINVSLSLLGTIAVALIVYAGFLWMTAGGNDDQITKARGIIYAAVIGLVIILSAYAISNFIIGNIYKATTNQTYP